MGIGTALALFAVALAFRAVPAAQLGPARPEAAWVFFLARSASLVTLLYGGQMNGVVCVADLKKNAQNRCTGVVLRFRGWYTT